MHAACYSLLYMHDRDRIANEPHPFFCIATLDDHTSKGKGLPTFEAELSL